MVWYDGLGTALILIFYATFLVFVAVSVAFSIKPSHSCFPPGDYFVNKNTFYGRMHWIKKSAFSRRSKELVALVEGDARVPWIFTFGRVDGNGDRSRILTISAFDFNIKATLTPEFEIEYKNYGSAQRISPSPVQSTQPKMHQIKANQIGIVLRFSDNQFWCADIRRCRIVFVNTLSCLLCEEGRQHQGIAISIPRSACGIKAYERQQRRLLFNRLVFDTTNNE